METNGLNMETHIPVEISLIIADADCSEIECEYTSLIKPICYDEEEFIKNSTPEALKVNGITYQMLREQGKLPTQVRFEIEDLFVKHSIFRGEAIFICQNPSFDRAFINKLFWHENMEELKWPYHWLDLASMYWIKFFGSCYPIPYTVSLSKDSIAHAMGLPPEEKPHRALNGVKHLMMCYKRIRGINCFINEPDLRP
jgi:DNA polymerase-3 subunit epsilon/oligoribonuclease